MLKRFTLGFTFFTLILLTLNVNGQLIEGNVKADKGKELEAVTLLLKATGTSAATDSAGNYRIPTTYKGKTWLICNAIGYQKDSVLLDLKGQTIKKDWKLKSASNELNTVRVSSVLKRISGQKTISTLNDLEIATTAGAAADVVAALQTLPGAAPAGNETGLFVRGGSAGETKAFIDGMLVKNPFGSRLPDVANRSRFSAFLFKESTFSTGSYAASYGQALSSALTLETKDLPHKTSSEFSVISLGGGGAHTQRFKNSALIVSADYYNFDLNNTLFRQNIDWNKNPRKYQAMINYKHKTSKTGMFKAIAEYSGTNLALNLVNPNYQLIDLLTNKNKNFYFNSTYRSFLTDNLSFFAGVSYNRTDESGDVNGQLYYQDDNAWQQKLMLSSFIGSNLVLSAGAEQFQSKRDEGFGRLDRGYSDVLSAVFVDAELGLLKRLTLKVGLRGEHAKYIDKSNIAPRAILAWSVNEASRFSGSYGYFYAKPDDSFLAQTSNLAYEAVQLYTLDYEYKKGPRNLRVEAYYKDYNDLVKITTPIYSGFQAYGPPVQIREFNNAGYGYARGFDLLWRDKKTLKIGEYYASYSFVDTKRNYIDFPDEARPSFVPMHTFNLVARKYVIKMKTQFSATYTFSSGRTYFNPNNQEFLGDKTQNNNNFSIGASYLPGWWKQFVVINFSVNNILGFNNVYGYRYAYDGSRRETILPPFKRGYLLSFLINIGDAGFNH